MHLMSPLQLPRTQSYYLSATDARGFPITWDHIIRLDRLDAELPLVLRTILGPSPLETSSRKAKVTGFHSSYCQLLNLPHVLA